MRTNKSAPYASHHSTLPASARSCIPLITASAALRLEGLRLRSIAFAFPCTSQHSPAAAFGAFSGSMPQGCAAALRYMPLTWYECYGRPYNPVHFVQLGFAGRDWLALGVACRHIWRQIGWYGEGTISSAARFWHEEHLARCVAAYGECYQWGT